MICGHILILITSILLTFFRMHETLHTAAMCANQNSNHRSNNNNNLLLLLLRKRREVANRKTLLPRRHCVS